MLIQPFVVLLPLSHQINKIVHNLLLKGELVVYNTDRSQDSMQIRIS